jgi:hypothetical protein
MPAALATKKQGRALRWRSLFLHGCSAKCVVRKSGCRIVGVGGIVTPG